MLKLDDRRVAGREEVGVVVGRRRRGGDVQPSRGAAPRDEEVAGGMAISDGMVGREPDGQRAAGEARQLHLHHLLHVALQVRVQLQHHRRGLGRREVDQRGPVHARLHEPRAVIVEQHAQRAIRARADLTSEEAIDGQHLGEAALDVLSGGRRRLEGIDDGHLDVVRDLVEHRGRDVLSGVRPRRALGVPWLDDLGAQHLHLHDHR
uniref:Uncharacterized protein n=1 Tax=Triticum urartu TaxID=4572 RepID=A0A8R7UIC0_TRIUA